MIIMWLCEKAKCTSKILHHTITYIQAYMHHIGNSVLSLLSYPQTSKISQKGGISYDKTSLFKRYTPICFCFLSKLLNLTLSIHSFLPSTHLMTPYYSAQLLLPLSICIWECFWQLKPQVPCYSDKDKCHATRTRKRTSVEYKTQSSELWRIVWGWGTMVHYYTHN